MPIVANTIYKYECNLNGSKQLFFQLNDICVFYNFSMNTLNKIRKNLVNDFQVNNINFTIKKIYIPVVKTIHLKRHAEIINTNTIITF